jgi:hypothetical protein
MRIILARMVFNFDMELDQPEKDWMDQEVFFLWDKPKLMIKLKPRAHFQRQHWDYDPVFVWLAVLNRDISLGFISLGVFDGKTQEGGMTWIGLNVAL